MQQGCFHSVYTTTSFPRRSWHTLARHKGRAALASLPLEPWTDRRRKDLLNLLAMLDAQLESLNDAVTRVAKEYPGVTLLMSQPDVLGHIGVQNR
jgi:hypothetical protein